METEKLLPVGEETPAPLKPSDLTELTPKQLGVPSAKAQSWGVVISIIVILMMVVVGAFYAWGERISENSQYHVPAQ